MAIRFIRDDGRPPGVPIHTGSHSTASSPVELANYVEVSSRLFVAASYFTGPARVTDDDVRELRAALRDYYDVVFKEKEREEKHDDRRTTRRD